MARSTMFGPAAPVVYGPEAPPKKPGPRPVMHGPEKPPKPKTFGPEEAPPVGYGSSERTPKAANRSDAPPRDEYAAQMLRLRRLAEKDENAPPPPNDYSHARQKEKDYQGLKGLKGLGVPGARGLPAAAATAFSMATDAYMEPAIQEETDRVMRQYGTTGNLVGVGGIGAQSMSSSRLADRGALMAAGVDAGVTIAQALLAARAGRAKEAAGMFALGLADMVVPAAVPGPPTRRGTNAHLKQQAQVAGVLGYDVGVTLLQEKLQAYANETGNKQLSQELKALAADPERLKQTIQK